jgi:hypothetical protein
MDHPSQHSASVTNPLDDEFATINARPKSRFQSLTTLLKPLIKLVHAWAPRSIAEDAYKSYLPSDRLSLEIGRYAAKRITPDQLADFKVFIKRLKDNQPSPYVVDWSNAVDEGASSVSRILRDPTNYGQTMRSIISFRPLVAKDELATIRRSHLRESPRADSLKP